MTISRRAKFVRWLTGKYIKGLDVPHLPVEKARAQFEKIAGSFLIRATGVEVEQTQIAGVDVDWLRPKNARKD